jgi:hypothetical protein
MHPVTVQLAGPHLRQIGMPDLIGLLRQHHAVDLAPSFGVEQAQLDLLGMLREQREIHAFSIPGCPQRVRATGPNGKAGHQVSPLYEVRAVWNG